MMNLLAIFETIRERHEADSYRLKDGDGMQVFAQEEWYSLDLDECTRQFLKGHVHLKNDLMSK